jgi:hypothetical protein
VIFSSIFATYISATSAFLPHHLKIIFLLYYKFKNLFFLKKKKNENEGLMVAGDYPQGLGVAAGAP